MNPPVYRITGYRAFYNPESTEFDRRDPHRRVVERRNGSLAYYSDLDSAVRGLRGIKNWRHWTDLQIESNPHPWRVEE